MKHVASLTAVLALLWLAWSGHYETLTLGLGAASLLVVVILASRMRVVDAEGVPLAFSNRRLLLYVPWLAREIIKSNVEVARRILAPGSPRIAPRLIRVQSTQTSAIGRVLYANSITLTPGTISIDVSPDGEILVHALYEEAAEGVLEGSMDRKVTDVERQT